MDIHGKILILICEIMNLLLGMVEGNKLGQPLCPVQHGSGAAESEKDNQHYIASVYKGLERYPFGDQHSEGCKIHAGDADAHNICLLYTSRGKVRALWLTGCMMGTVRD